MAEPRTESTATDPADCPPFPAPRLRTFLLLAVTLGTSIFLTGWIGAKNDELLSGRLSARTSVIRTPAAGRIDKWLVGSQKTVEQGTQLAILVDGSLRQRIVDKRREIASLESELKRRRAQADVDLAWRRRSLESEILANRLKAAELIRMEYDQRISQQAWKSVLRRMPRQIQTSSPDEVFRPAGFTIAPDPSITSRQKAMKGHESARNAAEVAAVKLQLREERLRELQRLVKELPANVRDAAGIEAIDLQLAAAKQELKQLEARPLQRTIVADAYGKLLARIGKSGDVLKAGDELARIVDDERRFLTVAVPANRLARFEVGKPVQLRFPGNQRRQGTIVEMAAPGDGTANDTNVVIEPAGKLWPSLPFGSAVQVVVPKE
jgi:multidrug resistance efflux pump